MGESHSKSLNPQLNSLESRHPEAEVGVEPHQEKFVKLDLKSNDQKKQLDEF